MAKREGWLAEEKLLREKDQEKMQAKAATLVTLQKKEIPNQASKVIIRTSRPGAPADEEEEQRVGADVAERHAQRLRGGGVRPRCVVELQRQRVHRDI